MSKQDSEKWHKIDHTNISRVLNQRDGFFEHIKGLLDHIEKGINLHAKDSEAEVDKFFNVCIRPLSKDLQVRFTWACLIHYGANNFSEVKSPIVVRRLLNTRRGKNGRSLKRLMLDALKPERLKKGYTRKPQHDLWHSMAIDDMAPMVRSLEHILESSGEDTIKMLLKEITSLDHKCAFACALLEHYQCEDMEQLLKNPLLRCIINTEKKSKKKTDKANMHPGVSIRDIESKGYQPWHTPHIQSELPYQRKVFLPHLHYALEMIHHKAYIASLLTDDAPRSYKQIRDERFFKSSRTVKATTDRAEDQSMYKILDSELFLAYAIHLFDNATSDEAANKIMDDLFKNDEENTLLKRFVRRCLYLDKSPVSIENLYISHSTRAIQKRIHPEKGKQEDKSQLHSKSADSILQPEYIMQESFLARLLRSEKYGEKVLEALNDEFGTNKDSKQFIDLFFNKLSPDIQFELIHRIMRLNPEHDPLQDSEENKLLPHLLRAFVFSNDNIFDSDLTEFHLSDRFSQLISELLLRPNLKSRNESEQSKYLQKNLFYPALKARFERSHIKIMHRNFFSRALMESGITTSEGLIFAAGSERGIAPIIGNAKTVLSCYLAFTQARIEKGSNTKFKRETLNNIKDQLRNILNNKPYFKSKSIKLTPFEDALCSKIFSAKYAASTKEASSFRHYKAAKDKGHSDFKGKIKTKKVEFSLFDIITSAIIDPAHHYGDTQLSFNERADASLRNELSALSDAYKQNKITDMHILACGTVYQDLLQKLPIIAEEQILTPKETLALYREQFHELKTLFTAIVMVHADRKNEKGYARVFIHLNTLKQSMVKNTGTLPLGNAKITTHDIEMSDDDSKTPDSTL